MQSHRSYDDSRPGLSSGGVNLPTVEAVDSDEGVDYHRESVEAVVGAAGKVWLLELV